MNFSESNFDSALTYGIILLNLCEITGENWLNCLYPRSWNTIWVGKADRCRSISCKRRYSFCLSEMSLKPILDNIRILKNITHMKQMLNMSCRFFFCRYVCLFVCFNCMSTVEPPKLFCSSMKPRIQFYPSRVLKALLSHQWNIPTYTKVKVVSQHILALGF